MKRCWCGNENLSEYSKDYLKCDKCHTLISKNMFSSGAYEVKDEKNDLYGENYWEIYMTEAAGKNTISEVVDMYLTERVLYWLKFVLKYVKFASDVAEVGCGLGQLQYVLRRLGYNQLAFELSPHICNYMEKNLGIYTHCGSFVERKNGYDAILAFDLFEHLDAPLKFMEQCSNSLKETGVLCFQTPCYNPTLSYDEMMKKERRFEEQLKANQHIYLYSREAMTDILKKYGFDHIVFEPAFFGNDYDMFFFASKREFIINTEEEIDVFLNSVDNGRLVKALLTLFDCNQDLNKKLIVAEGNSTARLEQINTLNQMLQESEADRAARMEQINTLNQMLQESEADRAARLDQINILTQMLQKNKEK